MNRIESVQNPKVKVWKKLHSKKGRDKEGLFIVEGLHLVEEVLKSEVKLKELIVEESVEIPNEWQIDSKSVIQVTERVFKEISETETPQGYIAICHQLKSTEIGTEEGKFLLLDGVQDPGNVGTMIRTADSAGISAVILGEGSVDVYNSKVIRATQGSLFHLPIVKGNLTEWITSFKSNKVPVFGTSLTEASTYTAIQPQEHFALIVGNEGEGVKQDILQQTDQNIYIPIYGKAESLNVAVATGILLYYLRG
ncbi:TrmH family RNA methyltransferase [Bacillus sp. FJAT-45350]|uniref:TrmH family RNA methyltransferase n=1 Tax=Bacillus sp. FJAT-45350 TaxID=2011014 RepID=UPI000BB73BDB